MAIKSEEGREKAPDKEGVRMKGNYLGDYLIMGIISIIGLAEVVHLAAMFLGLPFGRCAMLWGGLSGTAVLAVAGMFFYHWKKGSRNLEKVEKRNALEGILFLVFAILVISQLIFVCTGNTACREGDMTLETVKSFLAADGIYRINPMTGAAYTAGMPFRLKILCLPTLYACICRITGLSPDFVVRILIPVIVLVSCYASFGVLACSLFPAEETVSGRKRACFLAAAALIMWVGTYRYGMDGFQLLYCGWRGVTIRNCVLLPWLLSLCIRGKWMSAVLCILAEACMVWTLYGCGWCLFAALGMAAAGLYRRKRAEKSLRER